MSRGANLQHAGWVDANPVERCDRFDGATRCERAQSPIEEWNGDIASGRTLLPIDA